VALVLVVLVERPQSLSTEHFCHIKVVLPIWIDVVVTGRRQGSEVCILKGVAFPFQLLDYRHANRIFLCVNFYTSKLHCFKPARTRLPQLHPLAG
jgi:hypothetical protein